MRIPIFLFGLLPSSWLETYSTLQLGPVTSLESTTSIENIVLRNATLEDADDITHVFNAAFEPAEFYQYIYQFRHEYPEFHFWCQRQKILEALEAASQNDGVVLHVIDRPINHDTVLEPPVLPKPKRVVAIALWRFLDYQDSQSATVFPSLDPLLSALSGTGSHLMHDSRAEQGKFNCSQRLDQNITRAAYMDTIREEAAKKWIIDAYDHQLFLSLLATHPDWDGHDFAAAHLRWGLDQARAANVNTTLIATPAGHPVYKSVGFEDVANLTKPSLPGDKEGPFWAEVMRARP